MVVVSNHKDVETYLSQFIHDTEISFLLLKLITKVSFSLLTKLTKFVAMLQQELLLNP